jgi:hypothetical protein
VRFGVQQSGKEGDELFERNRKSSGFKEDEERVRLGSREAGGVARKCSPARFGGKRTLSNCRKAQIQPLRRRRRKIGF